MNKYGIKSSAMYMLRHFINDIEVMADKKGLARDKDRMLNTLTDGVLAFEELCKKNGVTNFSTTPIVKLTPQELAWMVTEYDLTNPFVVSKEIREKGYVLTSIKRLDKKYIHDWLIVVVHPELVVKTICQETCDLINNHESTIEYYTKLKPTMMSQSINGAWDIFMKLLNKGEFRDILDILLGRNTRPKRLKKWLLKKGYAELTHNI